MPELRIFCETSVARNLSYIILILNDNMYTTMTEVPPEKQRENIYKDFVRRAELFANATLKESFVDYIDMLHDSSRYSVTGMSGTYMRKLLPDRYNCAERAMLSAGLGVRSDSIYNIKSNYVPMDHSVSGGEKDFSFTVDISWIFFTRARN